MQNLLLFCYESIQISEGKLKVHVGLRFMNLTYDHVARQTKKDIRRELNMRSSL